MRSILKDVSIDEMLSMRAAGMTNSEIAKALGVGYSTLVKYIGPQPGRGGRVSKTIDIPTINAKPRTKMPDLEDVPEGVLPVVNRVICLRGEMGEYEVDTKSKRVTFTVGESVVQLDFEKWAMFAKEVNAIARKVGGIGLSPEIW